jgi:hypothetical protein
MPAMISAETNYSSSSSVLLLPTAQPLGTLRIPVGRSSAPCVEVDELLWFDMVPVSLSACRCITNADAGSVTWVSRALYGSQIGWVSHAFNAVVRVIGFVGCPAVSIHASGAHMLCRIKQDATLSKQLHLVVRKLAC